MIRALSGPAALAVLAACATHAEPLVPIDSADFIAAIEIAAPNAQLAGFNEPALEITELPPPSPRRRIEAASPRASLTPQQAIREGRAQALIEPSADGYVNAVQVYPYTEGALYRLYASPGQVSDIALQPGETLVSVSAGDTVRWVVGDTVSGAGAAARAHVLVKPISAGIRTNLMIATDRRTYHLELESVASGYMAALSWRYPADELAAISARAQQDAAREAVSIQPGVNLERLNFDYRVSGDVTSWRPVRVFDDGRQVFIQMPASVSTTDMPPLFILNEAGDAELVNYRVRGHYYVVDRLFRAAELRIGERRQLVVRITRENRRAGLLGRSGG